MSLAMQLRRGISAEIYKYKRTFTFWLLVLAPAFIPAINFLILTTKGSDLIKEGDNAWQLLISFSMGPANFLFPFFIIMIALLVNSLEYNANTWKLIYSQPLSRSAVYLSKMKVFILMSFMSLSLFSTFTILVGLSMRVIAPELGFNNGFDFGLVYGLYFKVFLSTLGMASIQFWISQRWKNLIIPLGVGIAGVISSIIAMQGWKYAGFHPYGYHLFATNGMTPENPNIWGNMEQVYLSIGVATIIFTLAGIEQVRKRIV